MHTLFVKYYDQHKSDRTKPYDGMPELLAELKAHGITAVCNTNKDYVFSENLLRSFYGDTLAEIVGAGLGYATKPDPKAALYLAEKYAVKGCKPLYVGDSGVDMQTSLNADIDGCGVLWGFRTRAELEAEGAVFLAGTPEELGDLILHP